MKNTAIVLVSLFLSFYNNAQVIYYQDVFYGGVTGFGGGVGANSGSISFNIDVEPMSTIRKVFLVVGADGEPEPISIDMNGQIINIDSTKIVTTGFSSYPGSPPPSSVNCIDLTADIDPNEMNYIMNIPPQNFSSLTAYNPFFILILYENTSLSKVAINIVLNNSDSESNLNYAVDNLFPINNSNEIGYSFLGRHICDTLTDGTNILINGNNIGLIGGSDNNTNSWWCTGVVGNFYYKNNIFYGMDDDTPDSFVSGTDGIANIQGDVNLNDQSINFTYQYQTPSQINGSKTNPFVASFLTYSTPCDTFSVSVPPDTTICRGESLQLNVVGGSQYEWLPATDLSCSTCPNPVFTGDSTQLYTVRIWNNDSCSVVRPMKITVDNCAGINENILPESFSIYPNPTAGIFNIDCTETLVEMSIEVLDLLGKVHFKDSFLSQKTQAFQLNLSPGTYLIKVSKEGIEFLTKRIILE